jgi:hypothetical protein
MLRILKVFLLVFISPFVHGQYLYQPHLSIEVHKEKKLQYPWAGGLNSVQVGTIDFDLDGLDDLVLFDRTSNKLNTFRNTGAGYEYAPEYEMLFPKGITGWIIFADYNCNGKKDIFTHTLFGIKVYENVSTDRLEWKKVADPIYTTGTAGDFNLQVNLTDIPIIADIDNDGDLDILVYNFAIGGYIRHHKNFSVENTGKCGLQFTRVSMSWGEFEECECDTFAFNGNTCYDIEGAIGGKVMHAGGKSMLLIDMNGNGVKDLLMSQEDCNKLYFLENIGTPDQALMRDFDMFFPDEGHPAHFERFPAAFHEDVDHDGRKDLLVSPNLPDDPLNTVDFKNSLWLYKNTGTSQNPDFTYVKRNFIQDEMIDEGWMARPFFADFDGDGDLDMFIAANGFEKNGLYYGAIALYENIGTAASPKFQKATSDFLGLSSQLWVDMKPMFVDINKDGAPDLVIPARTRGSGRRTAIYYLINKSQSGAYEFDPNDIRQLNFDQYAPGDNIYFYDVNKNGEMDILLGKVTGRIEYYRNDGNASSFTRVSQDFAGIVDNYTRRAPSFIIADLNNNRREELAVLDNSGIIRIIENFNTSNQVEHTKTYLNPLADREDSLRLGEYGQLALAPLIKGELPLLAIGSVQGGVFLMNNVSDAAGDKQHISLHVYPNPVNGSSAHDQSMVTIKVSMDARLEVFTLLGQRVFTTHVKKDEAVRLDPTILSHGIYIVRASAGRKLSKAVKLAVIK